MENLKYYLLFLVLIFYSTIFVKKYTDTMKKDPSQKGKKILPRNRGSKISSAYSLVVKSLSHSILMQR